jgi:hypothetical protein
VAALCAALLRRPRPGRTADLGDACARTWRTWRIRWEDGVDGYNPESLEIVRFGLERDFILKNKLTWIDNLITGSGKDLGSPLIPTTGCPISGLPAERSVAGSARPTASSSFPEMGRRLCEQAVLKYLGRDAEKRFDRKVELAAERIKAAIEDSGAGAHLRTAVDLLQGHDA